MVNAKQPKATFGERKGVLLVSAVCSVTCLALICAGFGTETWVHAEGCLSASGNSVVTSCSLEEDFSMDVRYGLFSGTKSSKVLGVSYFNLKIICLPDENVCMWSCMETAEERQQDVEDMFYQNGMSNTTFECTPNGAKSTRTSARANLLSGAILTDDSADLSFLNYGLWVMTIVFLSFAVLFSFGTTALAFLNVFTNPIENYMGALGLYSGNGLTLSTVFLAIIMWASQFNSYVVNDIALRDTMVGGYTTVNGPYLDSSMWMLVSALIIQCAAACCVYFRDIFRQETIHVVNEEEPVSNGAILIY